MNRIAIARGGARTEVAPQTVVRWSLFHSPLSRFNGLRTDLKNIKNYHSQLNRRGNVESGGIRIDMAKSIDLCLNEYPSTYNKDDWQSVLERHTETKREERWISRGLPRHDSSIDTVIPVSVYSGWRKIEVSTLQANKFGRWLLDDRCEGLCVIQADDAKNRALAWVDQRTRTVGALLPIGDQLYRYVYCATDQDDGHCNIPFAIMRIALFYSSENPPYSFSEVSHVWVDQSDPSNIIGVKKGKQINLFRDMLPKTSPLSTCDIARCLLGGEIPKSLVDPAHITAFKLKLASARGMSDDHRYRLERFVDEADEIDKILRVRFEI